jgi:hypothetical protein
VVFLAVEAVEVEAIRLCAIFIQYYGLCILLDQTYNARLPPDEIKQNFDPMYIKIFDLNISATKMAFFVAEMAPRHLPH